MAHLDDGRWVLLGVISFGTDCSKLLRRNVVARAQTYTNVALYGADIAHFTGFFLPPVYL
ncbi:unnamed protein product [Gongylonema pulchrum]|nr:unnamed protein product [Gongylonema pulchrum]